MQPVTLRTERLVLSPPAEGDIDAIFDACQDPEIQRYTTVPSPYHRDDAVGFVKKTAGWWDEGAEATWALHHAGRLAGVVGLHRLGRQSGAGEIGYWMTPAFRGQGLLTEAARAVIDWGFSPDGLALARIEWRAVVATSGRPAPRGPSASVTRAASAARSCTAAACAMTAGSRGCSRATTARRSRGRCSTRTGATP